MYYDFTYSNTGDEEMDKANEESKNYLLVKRILRNEKLPEASTFDTVLNLIDNVFCFMFLYDHRCLELFHIPLNDWMYCNFSSKHHYKFNDYNIPSTMERFFNISDKEIWYLLMLNFPKFNYQVTSEWRLFDETYLPYPSFKDEK